MARDPSAPNPHSPPATATPKEAPAPVSPKRTTRSSSSSAAAKSASLPDLLLSLPGRRPQALELLRLLGPPSSPALPLLLYGGRSTGKTRVLLRVLRHLARPFAYASCRSCYTPRLLFETLLDQLLAHRRSPSNAFAPARRCERPAEFVAALRGLASGAAVCLVIDNLELAERWGRNSGLVSLLLKLNDILRMPELRLIYVSADAPDVFYSCFGSTEPIGVLFPDYGEEEVYQILMRKRTNPEVYSSFLKVVLKPFIRVTRRIDEISNALKPLYEKYCELLGDPGIVPDESMKRRVYDILHPHIANALNQTFEVSSRGDVAGKSKSIIKKRKLSKSGCGWGDTSEELDFHLSVSAKYLLISAFLASRNPATLDAAMFDSTGGSSNQRRKRKSSELTLQKRDNKEQEMLMKGPGTFSLERLLVIFQCITSITDFTFEDEVLEGSDSHQSEVDFMSDVLLQLSTLCNAKFIYKGGSCPLEGSNRYRSNVDEDMALQVARSISFPLSKYIYRR